MVYWLKTTFASQSAAVIVNTWKWMTNHLVALGIDDYTHAGRSLHPVGVGITLDCTVGAIVSISKALRLPPYNGHARLRSLLYNVRTNAIEAVTCLQRPRAFIDTLNEGPIDRTIICLPLEVMPPDSITYQ